MQEQIGRSRRSEITNDCQMMILNFPLQTHLRPYYAQRHQSPQQSIMSGCGSDMLCKVQYNLTAQSFSDLSSRLSDNQFVISVDIMLD